MTQVRPDRPRREPLRARPSAPPEAPEHDVAPAETPRAQPAPPPAASHAAPTAPGPPPPPQAVPAPGAPSQSPPGPSEWSPMSAPPPPVAGEQPAPAPETAPPAGPAPAPSTSGSRNPLQRFGDLLLRQGTPEGAPVAPWRPVAAGGAIAAGGLVVLLQALVGAELIDIVLVLGLAMLVAGFLDGTGRRFRGPGVALVSVGIIGRFVGDTSFLGEGWGFAVFMLVYGAYVVVERQRHRGHAAA